MPNIDMPLEKLKEYKGVSPCPLDMDDFWDEAVKEMKEVDPKVEYIPADFKCSFAECYDMYFYSVGGAKIYAKYVKPKEKGKKHPALIKFHGYCASSGDWTDLLSFAAEGFHIAAMDCRGQAGRSQDNAIVNGNTQEGHIIRGLDEGPKKLLFRSIFLDTAKLASILINDAEIDSNKIGCFGRSQGGALSLACASLEPRIKYICAAVPFLCDYRRVWEMGLGTKAYREIQKWFRHVDPLHEREEEFFNTLSYIDIQNIVHRIKGRVLMVTALMDDTCPPSTHFAAYNKINAEKELLVYPDYGHEPFPIINDIIYKFMLNLT